MSDEKQNMVPDLRFPEFTKSGEWIGTTLNQISPNIFDGTHQTPTYVKSGIPFYSVENIVSGNKNKYISREDYLYETRNNKPEFGDVLVTRIGSIGIPKVVDWDHEFSVYVTLAVIKKSEEFDSHFLNAYIQSSRFQKEILRRSLLNAAPCKINMDEFRKCEILLPPNEEEQKKIAECVASLDTLIQSEKEKLDVLKDHKTGLLQQLFPAEGETIPQLRFPEFESDGEWQTKRIKEIADLTSSKRVHLSDYVEKGVPFFRGKEISELKKGIVPSDILFISEKHYSDIKEKYDVPVLGDILITAVGTLGNVYRIASDDPFYFKDGNLIWFKNISVNSSFLEFLLEAQKEEVLKTAIGSSQKALTMKALNELVLSYPNNPKEQEKIVDCLADADDLIVAQSLKVSGLEKHKKGLMQQLFPRMSEHDL